MHPSPGLHNNIPIFRSHQPALTPDWVHRVEEQKGKPPGWGAQGSPLPCGSDFPRSTPSCCRISNSWLVINSPSLDEGLQRGKKHPFMSKGRNGDRDSFPAFHCFLLLTSSRLTWTGKCFICAAPPHPATDSQPIPAFPPYFSFQLFLQGGWGGWGSGQGGAALM